MVVRDYVSVCKTSLILSYLKYLEFSINKYRHLFWLFDSIRRTVGEGKTGAKKNTDIVSASLLWYDEKDF
jgi:hypothetical protein